jgi:hypothetical protein
MMRFTWLIMLVVAAALARRSSAAELEPIRVADDKRSFVTEKSGTPFYVWGVNYDHDPDGRLIEDYWHDEWKTVEEDFAEMRELGVNVIRVHLQFGKFMQAADQPNDKELAQLAKLVALAEREQLYLDVTGLGCYHKADVPAWYDRLDESARWQAQATFWEAVAKACGGSPAIFCFDLMNEPVSPAGDKPGDDWLGPAFGGKHFVQRISLDRAGRERSAIARAWIDELVAAIRKVDKRTMITVGLVPWSLDRQGLTSGFVPEKIAEPLDFVAVHLYPERGKSAADVETLKGFQVGKPLIVEETFPLRCAPEELIKFIDEQRDQTSGWVSFYWGRPAKDYGDKTIGEAITADWLRRFQAQSEKLRK